MKSILIFFALLFSFQLSSQILIPKQNKIKVYFLGSFHFSQMDSSYNVLEDHHQKSIQKLKQTIVNLNPDKVFVERQPEFEFQNKIDSIFKKFVKNEFLLPKNEMFQIGFRVAAALNHTKVYQCDHPGMFGSYYNEVSKYAIKNDQLSILEGSQLGTVKPISNEYEENILKNYSLYDYLKWLNSDENLRNSNSYYISNYPLVGSSDYYNYDDDDTLIGAQLLAEWYRRNIMTYSKILNQLDFEESSIFIVIGTDHVPILSNFFKDHPSFKVIPASNWLN